MTYTIAGNVITVEKNGIMSVIVSNQYFGWVRYLLHSNPKELEASLVENEMKNAKTIDHYLEISKWPDGMVDSALHVEETRDNIYVYGTLHQTGVGTLHSPTRGWYEKHRIRKMLKRELPGAKEKPITFIK